MKVEKGKWYWVEIGDAVIRSRCESVTSKGGVFSRGCLGFSECLEDRYPRIVAEAEPKTSLRERFFRWLFDFNECRHGIEEGHCGICDAATHNFGTY